MIFITIKDIVTNNKKVKTCESYLSLIHLESEEKSGASSDQETEGELESADFQIARHLTEEDFFFCFLEE